MFNTNLYIGKGWGKEMQYFRQPHNSFCPGNSILLSCWTKANKTLPNQNHMQKKDVFLKENKRWSYSLCLEKFPPNSPRSGSGSPLSIYLFIQQIWCEHLCSTRNWSRCRRDRVDKTEKILVLVELNILIINKVCFGSKSYKLDMKNLIVSHYN